jgi:hypothetical protein
MRVQRTHRTRGLTPRSRRGPTALHLAREALWYMMRLAGQAQYRRSRLNSNVRRRSKDAVQYAGRSSAWRRELNSHEGLRALRTLGERRHRKDGHASRYADDGTSQARAGAQNAKDMDGASRRRAAPGSRTCQARRRLNRQARLPAPSEDKVAPRLFERADTPCGNASTRGQQAILHTLCKRSGGRKPNARPHADA